jgi:hypothetical protein
VVHTKPLLTHAFDLAEMPAALQAARDGVGVKVHVLPDAVEG